VAMSKVIDYKTIRIITADEQSVNQVFKDVKTNGIFIVDTLNNIILRYPTQNDQQEAVLHSRDILSDMRKVLKLSRIG
jgi:alpha-acetolactate decarboxylase